VVFLGIAVAVIWISNIWLTDRFTESTRNRSELRLALYSGSILSELQRHSVVPLLLSRDPVLIRSLQQNDFSTTSQRLISYVEEIGAASLILLNRDGRIVAATDRQRISELRSSDPFFVEALRSPDTVFTSNEPETGRFDFTFSRRIEVENNLLGVILVEVDLSRIVDRWRGTTEAVFLTNSEGQIILSTEPRWRGRTEEEALELEPAPSAIERAIEATGNWAFGDQNALFFGAETIRLEARIPFRGWRIVSHTAYASVRERVNGVLALEIMGFALFLAGGFYVLSRRARLQSAMFQRESAELRRLNARLQREIAERQKAERNLEEAEQSLAQSQKLAALGEMSAAVSHELNQPLAAMKTYLAGARLLLHRRRFAEAGSSFQRIDDLIERMGAITRQLKSYARKGGDAFEPVDLRDALKGGLTIMEPQLRVAAGGDHAEPAAPPGDGSGRPAAAGTGDHQPAAKRARRDEGQRQARDRPPDRRGRRGGPVGARQRPRHRGPRDAVRALLHHQEARRGRRAGACHFLGDRVRPRRAFDRAQPRAGGAVFEIRCRFWRMRPLSGEGSFGWRAGGRVTTTKGMPR
jgi:two-component system C4-dicarboxylate transport sensor histidine kinase DctB